MAIPDYQSLMFPVLVVAAKAETSVPLAETAIATKFGLSNEEREQILPSGKQRVLHNRIHWAKFYLTKAGLLESPKRGRFAITPAGQQVLANPPATLDTKYCLRSPRSATSTAVGTILRRSPRRLKWSPHLQPPRRWSRPHTKLSTSHFGQISLTASFKTAPASSNRSSWNLWWRWATGAHIEMRQSNLANRVTGALTV